MELVKDKGSQVLYNKLDMAYSSSDEETEETDVRCAYLILVLNFTTMTHSVVLFDCCREKEMTSI